MNLAGVSMPTECSPEDFAIWRTRIPDRAREGSIEVELLPQYSGLDWQGATCGLHVFPIHSRDSTPTAVSFVGHFQNFADESG
jgi:hypothetical protein